MGEYGVCVAASQSVTANASYYRCDKSTHKVLILIWMLQKGSHVFALDVGAEKALKPQLSLCDFLQMSDTNIHII